MTQHVTILSGDIVAGKATSASDLDECFDGLAQAAEMIQGWQNAPVAFTRLGDTSWQLVLAPARPGLREALTLRAGLRQKGRQFDTAIAMVSGNGLIPADGDLGRAEGLVFLTSLGILDSLKGARFGHGDGSELAAVARLVDHVSARWTAAQAKAVLPMMAPDAPTHSTVAESLGITRQAVRQALMGAGYPALSEALTEVEATPQPQRFGAVA
ncbi:hypothetical protein SAMN06297129_2736 [Pseudooceanicola antarcticus]|uniref:SatD family (SatD) n=1 Tax=Pseudooceanicola antarcticus TaxID=1247613 RepID=A0A285J2J7_9RHOB|nr:hypothetical protein [Pseudooceanicola antarcticus]PJE29856.1 hypothetical protein CVM39_08120 [Pseudooceanicola antarcticus]SNY54087.1 hypothetical protein SAMN06297129_2736 [Pseudooceanicola antarcticus]